MASLYKSLGVAALAGVCLVSAAQFASAAPPPRKVLVGLLTTNPRPQGQSVSLAPTSNSNKGRSTGLPTTTSNTTTTTTTTSNTTTNITSGFLAPTTSQTTSTAPFLGNPPASIIIP